MMSGTGETLIRVSEENLRYIYAGEYQFFKTKIIPNCYCSQCPNSAYTSTIVDYDIFINDLYDIVLQGSCATCGGKIGRYLETGEEASFLPRIKMVLKGPGFSGLTLT